MGPWGDEYKMPNYGAEALRESANEYQHGGDHYHNGATQHWDLVAILRLDYYLGNATKYLSRAHKKNGVEDYRKAAHYIQKRNELGWDNYIIKPRHVDLVYDFMRAQQMPPAAKDAMYLVLVGSYTDARQLIEKELLSAQGAQDANQ